MYPKEFRQAQHSRQQDLAVHISRTSHVVNVVQNIILPQGQLLKVAVVS